MVLSFIRHSSCLKLYLSWMFARGYDNHTVMKTHVDISYFTLYKENL